MMKSDIKAQKISAVTAKVTQDGSQSFGLKKLVDFDGEELMNYEEFAKAVEHFEDSLKMQLRKEVVVGEEQLDSFQKMVSPGGEIEDRVTT